MKCLFKLNIFVLIITGFILSGFTGCCGKKWGETSKSSCCSSQESCMKEEKNLLESKEIDNDREEIKDEIENSEK